MQYEERQVGAYRLHKYLEQGIIADTYLATHLLTKQHVIVKMFQITLSEEQRAQCVATIRTCAQLEHPALLRPLDFGEEDNVDTTSLFLVMDTYGETLRQRHPQGQPFPLDTLALYVSQIANALQFAHNHTVLHLNLRPEQLFVGPNGRIMLDMTSRLPSSAIPTFLPPDKRYTPHEAAGPASDQYALAMIIYEWLGGTLPLGDTTREAINTRRSLPVPGEQAPLIWPRVEHVLRQALALDPAQRYEHIQTFADAFLRALNIGSEAARLRQEIHRQISGGADTSFTVASSLTMGNRHTTGNWHNPFRSGFHYTLHSIHTLVFSPDSKQLAFTSYEPAVFVATIAEPGTIFTYQGHIDQVSAVAWSPDGQTIASLSSNATDGEIQIWEAATGRLIATYLVHPSTHVLQWSPDGNFLATGGWDHTVHIFHHLTGKTVLTFSNHTSAVTSLSWSPDNTRLASASWEGIHVWEVTTGTLICTYRGQYGEIKAVAWSPDGRMVVSGGSDMTIHIWHAATRAPLFLHRLSSATITVLGWSSDGEYILVGTRDNTIQAINVKDGGSAFHYHAHTIHTEHMNSIAWSPDLSILAIGGEDRRVELANRTSGKVLLCRAPAVLLEEIGQGEVSQQETMTTTDTSSISSGQTTTITTTTTTLVPAAPPVVHTTTRQRRSVRVWGGKDSRDTVIYFEHRSAVKPLAWSPDSSRIASGGYDGSMHVWDAVTSTTIFIYRGHLDPVVAVAWSPDGTRLASGSLDHTVKVWDLFTGREILTYRGHTNFVQAIAWSPDSSHIVSGSEDTTVQVWDANTGKTILTYSEHTAAISSVNWSIDEQHIASGSHDQTVHIWDAATGNTVFVYRKHTAAVLAVAWSPDGKRIASGSAHKWRSYEEIIHKPDHEATLHIWTAPAGQTATIHGQDEHPGIRHDMDSITWSPDGQMIATLGMPYARIYDTNTGEAMAMIMNPQHDKQPDKLLAVAWSPNGRHIASSLNNGRVQVWPARAQSS